MSQAAGHLVTIDTHSLHVPSSCCRCGAPATTQVKNSIRFGNRTRSLDLPYCDACKTRSQKIMSRRTGLYVMAGLIAAVLAGLGALLPMLMKPVLIGAPVAFAVLIAAILRRNAGEAVDYPYGAWMVRASNSSSTFFGTHEPWAQALAAANGVKAVPARASDPVRPWIGALFISAAAATYVAVACQPAVYIDVAGPKPLQIWLDGKPSIVAESKTGEAPRPSVEVPYGSHRFGWSAVGADKPAGETAAVKVAWMGHHLYNPASTTCYDLVLSVYGSAKGEGMADGPQSVHEFYTFKDVDNWFKANPRTVSTKSSGATRTALVEDRLCHDLAQLGCGLPIRSQLMECLHASTNDRDDAGCVQQATNACKQK
jgi:hypothetical protein